MSDFRKKWSDFDEMAKEDFLDKYPEMAERDYGQALKDRDTVERERKHINYYPGCNCNPCRGQCELTVTLKDLAKLIKEYNRRGIDAGGFLYSEDYFVLNHHKGKEHFEIHVTVSLKK